MIFNVRRLARVSRESMHQKHHFMTVTATSHNSASGVLARILLFGFTLLGLCIAAFAMYAAWQHNPQGEYHDETGVHWIDLITIGFFWFAAIAGIPWLVAIRLRFRHR
jgi:hypothetical protein